MEKVAVLPVPDCALEGEGRYSIDVTLYASSLTVQ